MTSPQDCSDDQTFLNEGVDMENLLLNIVLNRWNMNGKSTGQFMNFYLIAVRGDNPKKVLVPLLVTQIRTCGPIADLKRIAKLITRKETWFPNLTGTTLSFQANCCSIFRLQATHICLCWRCKRSYKKKQIRNRFKKLALEKKHRRGTSSDSNPRGGILSIAL